MFIYEPFFIPSNCIFETILTYRLNSPERQEGNQLRLRKKTAVGYPNRQTGGEEHRKNPPATNGGKRINFGAATQAGPETNNLPEIPAGHYFTAPKRKYNIFFEKKLNSVSPEPV